MDEGRHRSRCTCNSNAGSRKHPTSKIGGLSARRVQLERMPAFLYLSPTGNERKHLVSEVSCHLQISNSLSCSVSSGRPLSSFWSRFPGPSPGRLALLVKVSDAPNVGYCDTHKSWEILSQPRDDVHTCTAPSNSVRPPSMGATTQKPMHRHSPGPYTNNKQGFCRRQLVVPRSA